MSSSNNKNQRNDGFDLDSMGKKDYEAEMERKKYRRNASIISVILAVFVVLVIVFTSGFSYRTLPAVSVADENYSATEYNYYYKSLYYRYYNSYYTAYGEYASMLMPQEEQLQEETFTFIAQNKMLNDEAAANGFTLSEEELAAIDEEIENIKSIAHENGYATLGSYLTAYYGKGMNVNTFRECMINDQVAIAYTAQLTGTYDYDDAELEEFYSENEDSYDVFTYRQFSFSGLAGEDEDADAAMAEAESDAKAFAAAVTSEKSFGDLAYEYAAEDQKASYEEEDATLRSAQGQNLSADLAEWLTDDSRRYGNVTTIETASGWQVVYFVDRDDNDYATKNVRHVLIADTGDEEADLGMATDLLKKWEREDGTEDGFAAMAVERSADPGSAANGGLYENVEKGRMVEEFESWIYDSSRQSGDTEVIKTVNGYHIMYFVGDGENYRMSIAEDSKITSEYSAWVEEHLEGYEATTNWWFNYAIKK